MYEMLQTDMRQMREEGYVEFLMGDFNGHLGPQSIDNPDGVIGDTMQRNKNGSLLLEFVKKEDLVIGNNLEQCVGTFTRIERGEP